MTKPLMIFSIVGAGMMVAIIGLWLRVGALESTIDDLTHRLQSLPRMLPVTSADTRPAETRKKRPIFKLIDSADANGGTTNVGIPWSVEHAMMIDGIGRSGAIYAPTFIDKQTTIDGEFLVSPPATLEGLPNTAPTETTPDSAR